MPAPTTPPRSVPRHQPMSGFEYIAACGKRKQEHKIVMRTFNFPVTCIECIAKVEEKKKKSTTPAFIAKMKKIRAARRLANKSGNFGS